MTKKVHLLKKHGMSYNPKNESQKQLTFTPKQIMLEVSGFQRKIPKTFEGTQNAWGSFLKPAVDTLAPVMATAVGAKNKIPEFG